MNTYSSISRTKSHTFGGLKLFRLTSTSGTTCKSSERNDLLVLLDISEVGVCFGELES